MSECRICTASCANVDLLCRHHRETLAGWLAEIPDGVDHRGYPAAGLLTELTTSLARLDRCLSDFGAGVSAETSLPWNDRASRARITLVATIMHWSRVMAERDEDERDRLADVWPDPMPLAEWMTRNLTTLVRHDDVLTGYADVRDAVVAAREACDLDALRKFPVGPCPVIKDGYYCSGQIWASLPTSDDEPAVLDCLTCGSEWGSTRWYRLSRQIEARRQRLAQAV